MKSEDNNKEVDIKEMVATYIIMVSFHTPSKTL